MVVAVNMEPDTPRGPVPPRTILEMYLALTVEGVVVRDVTDGLAVQVEIDAPDEEMARRIVADIYASALPPG